MIPPTWHRASSSLLTHHVSLSITALCMSLCCLFRPTRQQLRSTLPAAGTPAHEWGTCWPAMGHSSLWVVPSLLLPPLSVAVSLPSPSWWCCPCLSRLVVPFHCLHTSRLLGESPVAVMSCCVITQPCPVMGDWVCITAQLHTIHSPLLSLVCTHSLVTCPLPSDANRTCCTGGRSRSSLSSPPPGSWTEPGQRGRQ